MKEFTMHIFQHIPFLRVHAAKVGSVLDEWKGYKQSVPTFGAILLNEDMSQVLLVQSYWSRASWGFPKGKVNKDEDPYRCAIREVLEETGFDISRLIDKNDFIEAVVNEQTVRLYVVTGINTETKFQPRTRNEIKNVEWFPIADLPSNKKDITSRVKMGVGPNAFFMVLPFIKRLKRWIQEKQQGGSQVFRRNRQKSVGEVEVSQSKNKRQQFAQVIQAEMQEMQALKQMQELQAMKQDVHSSPPARVARRSDANSRSQKPSFKRQLFTDQLAPAPQQPQPHCHHHQPPHQQAVERNHPVRAKESSAPTRCDDFQFSAPSWVNFKFNRKAILACLEL
ncbi:m7GpppN-mRNA hydrolase isoform X2 [Bacillus rossius redtenbacheri]